MQKCDDDHPMGVAAISPAGHKRQSLIGEVVDPLSVFPPLIAGHMPLRGEKHLSCCVLVLLFPYLERDQVAGPQLIQVAKDLSSNVMVA